jgi:hypothetical protein
LNTDITHPAFADFQRLVRKVLESVPNRCLLLTWREVADAAIGATGLAIILVMTTSLASRQKN